MATRQQKLWSGDYRQDCPTYLYGNVDQEASQEDFVFMVQQEIDLLEEGEESNISNSMQLQFCKEYVREYKRY